jgi:hypothetical protein
MDKFTQLSKELVFLSAVTPIKPEPMQELLSVKMDLLSQNVQINSSYLMVLAVAHVMPEPK